MAKTPEFKRLEGVTMKLPEVAGLFGEEPVAPATPEIEWADIPNFAYPDAPPYPHNGEPVWLTPDGTTEDLAVWRVTRALQNGRFQPTAFWAIHHGGGQRIGFEPLGYRRYEPPIYVPKKSA